MAIDDKSSSNKPSDQTRTSTSGKDLIARINQRKALAQRRNVPILRAAPAVENEEDAGDEGGGDDEDEDDEEALPKGKGKIDFGNFQDVIIGAVRKAMVELGPEIGMSIATTPKKTRVSSQRAAISMERNAYSKPVQNRISVSINEQQSQTKQMS